MKEITFNEPEDKQELTFLLLRASNITRCNISYHDLHSWSPTDWACAVAGEAGEMCNFVKKLRRLEDKNVSTKEELNEEEILINIGKELADIVIYTDLLAARLGMNLSTEIIKKFNEVSDRIGSKIKI